MSTDRFVKDLEFALAHLKEDDATAAAIRWQTTGSNADLRSAVLLLAPVVLAVLGKLNIPKANQDDCVQAGHLAVIQALSSWDRQAGKTLVSWVWQYVAREISREAARGATTETYPIPDEDEVDDGLDGERAVTVDDLRIEIGWLPQLEQKLMLGVLAGASVSSVGESLGLSQSRADRMYKAAVKKLRHNLSG